MSEESNENPQQAGPPIGPDDALEEGGGEPKRPSKASIAVASVFMVLPSVIPFYYAVRADDTTMMLVMLAFGLGVLLINVMILIMVYRWILRMMD